MSFSGFFPTVFCSCYAVGYGVVAILMWRGGPERFEKLYTEFRRMSPFPSDVTRGTLRAHASSAPSMLFLALAVAAGDAARYQEAAGHSPRVFSALSGASLILMFIGWGFYAVVSVFSWPRWLLFPYVRDEKSVWVARREARAKRRAARASPGDASR